MSSLVSPTVVIELARPVYSMHLLKRNRRKLCAMRYAVSTDGVHLSIMGTNVIEHSNGETETVPYSISEILPLEHGVSPQSLVYLAPVFYSLIAATAGNWFDKHDIMPLLVLSDA